MKLDLRRLLNLLGDIILIGISVLAVLALLFIFIAGPDAAIPLGI